MKKNIIFLGGVHCVGKTTFTDKIKESIPSIETLSCSDVLKWKNPSNKNVLDIAANQNTLIDNLFAIIDKDKPYLLDGHFCLLNDNNYVERIGIETFRDIDPEMIILLIEDVNVIKARLCKRDNREYDLKTLEQLATEEYKYANDVAVVLGVPIHILKASEYNNVVEEIRNFALSFD